MNVDAAAGGALMNKTYIGAYALIEDITAITPPPSKKEAGMYEVSILDHLSAKVDTLFKKFDKLSVSVVTPAPISPPCEVCGILGHIGVEWQLGSTVESSEQLNYDPYNQGMRSNQKFYNKIPQNPFGHDLTWSNNFFSLFYSIS